MKSISRTRRVNRKRARRITKAALKLLYGPPESHDQDDDKSKPVPVPTDIQLAEIATSINDLHEEAQKSAKRAVECAVEAGRLLTQAKDRCGHGEFANWVKANCEFSQRTAQTYMRIASHPNAQRVAHLPLREALAELADHKGPRKRNGMAGHKRKSKTIDLGSEQVKSALSLVEAISRDLRQNWSMISFVDLRNDVAELRRLMVALIGGADDA